MPERPESTMTTAQANDHLSVFYEQLSSDSDQSVTDYLKGLKTHLKNKKVKDRLSPDRKRKVSPPLKVSAASLNKPQYWNSITKVHKGSRQESPI